MEQQCCSTENVCLSNFLYSLVIVFVVQRFWKRVTPYGKSLPERGNNSCVPPPPGPGGTGHARFFFFFSFSDNSLSLPSLLHHTLARAAMAFTSLLPTGQADGQVYNDCHITLMPATPVPAGAPAVAEIWSFPPKLISQNIRGDGSGSQGGKPARRMLGAYAKRPVRVSSEGL